MYNNSSANHTTGRSGIFLCCYSLVILALATWSTAQTATSQIPTARYDGSLIYHNVANLTYLDDTLHHDVQQVTINRDYGAGAFFQRTLVLDLAGNIIIDVGYREEGVITLTRHRYDAAGERLQTTYYESHIAVMEVEFQQVLSVQQPRQQGDDVRVLQQALAEAGYTVGEIDGIYGPNTEAAVRAFQADQNIAIDGIAGAVTWHLAVLPETITTDYRRNPLGEVVATAFDGDDVRVERDDQGRVMRETSFVAGEMWQYRLYQYQDMPSQQARATSSIQPSIQPSIQVETYTADDTLLERDLHTYNAADQRIRHTSYRTNAQTGDPESFRWSVFTDSGVLLEEGFEGDVATVHLYRYDHLGNWTSYAVNDGDTIRVHRYHDYQLDACQNWTTRTVYTPHATGVTVMYRDLRIIRYHRDCQHP